MRKVVIALAAAAALPVLALGQSPRIFDIGILSGRKRCATICQPDDSSRSLHGNSAGHRR